MQGDSETMRLCWFSQNLVLEIAVYSIFLTMSSSEFEECFDIQYSD